MSIPQAAKASDPGSGTTETCVTKPFTAPPPKSATAAAVENVMPRAVLPSAL
jgi:hypothetical protein